MSEEIWNQQEKEIIEEIENNQNITTNDIYYWYKKVVKEGTPNLLQYLSNLSQKLFSLTLPSLFANALKTKLIRNAFSNLLLDAYIGGNLNNFDYHLSLFRGKSLNGIVLANSIERILPSISLKLIEHFIEKEVKIFKIKASSHKSKIPKILLSSFNNTEQLQILENKEETKAQLELLKKVQSLCGIDLLNETDEIKKSIIISALKSLNLKIIKYFLSLNLFDIKQPIWSERVLSYVLRSIKSNGYYSIDREEWKYIPNIFKYLVAQGASMSLHSNIILFYAVEIDSLKMIKYFISFGANINYLDKYDNNVLFKVFNKIISNGNSNIEKRIKIAKYFISISGINLIHQNDNGMDALLYSLQLGNFELIKMIIPLIKYQFPLKYNSRFLQEYINNLLATLNLEMIKYLDKMDPLFSDYFNGENKIKSKNSILIELIKRYLTSNQEGDFNYINFIQFKQLFNYLLSRGNNINSIDNHLNLIPLQKIFTIQGVSIPWKLMVYLIDKGSNLHHISDYGSILNILTNDLFHGIGAAVEERKRQKNQFAKYILIKSMEINNSFVVYPKFSDLHPDATFDNIILKNNINNIIVHSQEKKENELENSLPKLKVARINNKEVHHDIKNNEEDKIYWKREFIINVIKHPKILDYVGSYDNRKLKFDDVSKEIIFI